MHTMAKAEPALARTGTSKCNLTSGSQSGYQTVAQCTAAGAAEAKVESEHRPALPSLQ